MAAPEYSEDPLTDVEIRAFRELLESERRAKWFWALSRSVAVWILAVTTGFVAFYDSVAAMINRIFGIK
jgi:hypothetical protein